MPVVINGTSGITGPDGSSSAPALKGTDSDTGFVFSAGNIQASLNGTSANVALVSGTAQNSTSGTSIDFTGIPSWVKRVTVMFNGVSTSGTSAPIIRLGTSSGFVATNYVSAVSRSTASASSTTGFLLLDVTIAANTNEGLCIISNVSGNAWSYLSNIAISANSCGSGAGSISAANLGGTLDRIRITTVNGTDTFDAGSINIMYE